MTEQQAGSQATQAQQAEPQAEITVYLPSAAHKALACECGQFSADRGDYFMRGPSQVFHCLDCDADMELRRRVQIVGRTPDGRQFWAHGWEVVKEDSVTLADLD